MEKRVYTKLIQLASAAARSCEFRRKNAKRLALTLVITVVVLLAGCSKPAAETPQGVDVGDAKAAAAKTSQADQLYAQREDLGKLRQAVALLRQARIEDYGSFDAAWKLSRAAYNLGDRTSDDRERDNSFREGEEAGKAAVKLDDSKAEGHFWLGANYGGNAKHSTLASLSSVDDIRTQMETVLKIDESFQAGSAYMVLGQLYLEAPRVLGGDIEKATGYLEKGLKFGQTNALLRLRLAEAYHRANRDGEARKQIAYLTTMKVDPNYAAEYNQAIEEAKKLEASMK
jgi:TRAP transporter TatT component family protein